VQNVLTLQGIFQPVSLQRSPFFGAASRGTHDSVSSIVKTGYKARYTVHVQS